MADFAGKEFKGTTTIKFGSIDQDFYCATETKKVDTYIKFYKDGDVYKYKAYLGNTTIDVDGSTGYFSGSGGEEIISEVVSITVSEHNFFNN